MCNNIFPSSSYSLNTTKPSNTVATIFGKCQITMTVVNFQIYVDTWHISTSRCQKLFKGGKEARRKEKCNSIGLSRWCILFLPIFIHTFVWLKSNSILKLIAFCMSAFCISAFAQFYSPIASVLTIGLHALCLNTTALVRCYIRTETLTQVNAALMRVLFFCHSVTLDRCSAFRTLNDSVALSVFGVRNMHEPFHIPIGIFVEKRFFKRFDSVSFFSSPFLHEQFASHLKWKIIHWFLKYSQII